MAVLSYTVMIRAVNNIAGGKKNTKTKNDAKCQ